MRLNNVEYVDFSKIRSKEI